jgi:hypothetical protein
VRIVPHLPGRFQWSDPGTLVFKPEQAYRAGQQYQVVFDSTFSAPDGGRRADSFPVRFRFELEVVAPSPPSSPLAPVEVRFVEAVVRRPGRLPGAPAGLWITPRVSGTWDAPDTATLRFTPRTPFRPDQRYQIELDTAFRTVHGGAVAKRKSMEIGLVLGAYSLQYGGGPKDPIRIGFGGYSGFRPGMHWRTLPGVTFTPPIAGSFEIQDSMWLTFTPEEPLRPNVEYVVRIDSSFRAPGGTRLRVPFQWSLVRTLKLRDVPGGTISATGPLVIVFDRPLVPYAGTHPPRGVQLLPPSPGTFETIDSVKLRFVPATPLLAEHYRLTVDTSFVSRDGERLQAPLKLDFRPALSMGSQSFGYPIVLGFTQPVSGDTGEFTRFPAWLDISPAVPGRLRWRYPNQLEIYPDSSLDPSVQYTLRLDTTLRALDGTRFFEPFVTRFRGPAPVVLALWPLGRGPSFLTGTSRLQAVVLGRVQAESLAAQVRLQPTMYSQGTPACESLSAVRFSAGQARALTATDTAASLGWWLDQERLRQHLHIIPLSPDRELPADCTGAVAIGDRGGWSFQTPGRLEVASISTRPSPDSLPHDAWITLQFSAPVDAADLARHLQFEPRVPYHVEGGPVTWQLSGSFKPGRSYRLTIRAGLVDAFGSRMPEDATYPFHTADAAPAVSYPGAHSIIPPGTALTLTATVIGTRAVNVCAVPVPDSLATRMVRDHWWSWKGLDHRRGPQPVCRREPVSGPRNDSTLVTVRAPWRPEWGAPRGMIFTRVSPAGSAQKPFPAVIQVTNLEAHAFQWGTGIAVWVTDGSGVPIPGATAAVFDCDGRLLAQRTTDKGGMIRLPVRFFYSAGDATEACILDSSQALVVRYHGDRLVLALPDPYDSGRWEANHVGLGRAVFADSSPVRAIVTTDRGVYLPGEGLYATAVLTGAGEGRADGNGRTRFRWVLGGESPDTFEPVIVFDSSGLLSRDGLASLELQLSDTLPEGPYRLLVQVFRSGRWVGVASADIALRPYRTSRWFAGLRVLTQLPLANDSLRIEVDGRLLNEAPATGLRVSWSCAFVPAGAEGPGIPGEGYGVGTPARPARPPYRDVVATGAGVLGGDGRTTLVIPLPGGDPGWPYLAKLVVTVADSEGRQLQLSRAVRVHQGPLYSAMRRLRGDAPAVSGVPDSVELLTVYPGGERVAGVTVRARLIARRWEPSVADRAEAPGSEGPNTEVAVEDCEVRSNAAGLSWCVFHPVPGAVGVEARTADAAGRETVTRQDWFWSLRVGADPALRERVAPKVTLTADRARYAVGDTASLLVETSGPATHASIVVLRHGVREARVVRLAGGHGTIRLGLPKEFAPGVTVSVLVSGPRRAAGTFAATASVDLAVEDRDHELTVGVQQGPSGDGHRAIELAVVDGRGRPREARMNIWVVDERALALSDHGPPDLLAIRGVEGPAGGWRCSCLQLAPVAFEPADPGASISVEMDAEPTFDYLYEASRPARPFPPRIGVPGGVPEDYRPTVFSQAGVHTDERGMARITMAAPLGGALRLVAVAVTSDGAMGTTSTLLDGSLP